MMYKPSTEVDGWMFGATKEAPAIGSLGFNNGKETSKTADGWDFIEAKVHL
jgi:hypothetical protein